MEVLARRLEFEEPEQAERLRAYDDLTTQFSELIDGNMRTNFELSFDGSELYGRDGRGMGAVTKASIDDAERIVRQAPNLSFELRRRRLEREEYLELITIARGQGPNTMVVLSDFPEELMDSPHDIGGYNVTRKQTMLRVLTRQPNGSIKMYSQSLDRSERRGLEAIYSQFSEKPEPGELLGQRITADLPADQQANLVDRLMGIYDRELSTQYGGDWHAGRRPADYRNTYDFVCEQRDLLQACIELNLNNQLDDRIMYNIAATMQARFRANKQGVFSIMPRIIPIDPSILINEMELAGMRARQSGQTFSACGTTLKAHDVDVSLDSQLEGSGYGNKSDEETKYSFNKSMHCVSCQAPPKKGEPKLRCGPCGLCRRCDKKFGGKG